MFALRNRTNPRRFVRWLAPAGLVALFAVAGFAGQAARVEQAATWHEATALNEPPDPLIATFVVPWSPNPPVPRANLDIPWRCDGLARDPGPRGFRKRRAAWFDDKQSRAAYQRWIQGLIQVVGDEMGVDSAAATMLFAKAMSESGGNSGALHLLSADLRANRRAAKRGKRLSSARWRDATVPIVDGSGRAVGEYDAWALGYGLFGQVTALHVRRWGLDVPPWSLCDPIVAVVTTIWSMREGIAQCRGKTLRDAHRRFSAGHCGRRSPEREARFDRLARGRNGDVQVPPFNPDAPARLGSRWREKQTDRAVLLARLRARVLREVGPAPTAAQPGERS